MVFVFVIPSVLLSIVTLPLLLPCYLTMACFCSLAPPSVLDARFLPTLYHCPVSCCSALSASLFFLFHPSRSSSDLLSANQPQDSSQDCQVPASTLHVSLSFSPAITILCSLMLITGLAYLVVLVLYSSPTSVAVWFCSSVHSGFPSLPPSPIPHPPLG